MTQSTSGLVRKLWQYCNVLRDDGLSYPDYVEQLTYLLFLKMADERPGEIVPADHSWQSFASRDTQELREQYEAVLRELGSQPGTLGLIFKGARNKISDPAKLRYLVVELVGQTEWTGLSADVKGDAYEGLLEKNARDTKSGAGQYFTPRPLIESIVECLDPQPGEVICDPACGTGGFLLAARDHVERAADDSAAAAQHLETRALRGVELVQEVARLAAMNLFLHGVAGETSQDVPIRCEDSLLKPPHEHVDVVLSNPPFGIKGSVMYATAPGPRSGTPEERTVVRPDFWARTANKQLNFLQHIITLLRPTGRAAVVVPDNVLFESGAAAVVRRRLLQRADVHTLLRLPPGLFYATGVLANVLFFDATPRADSARLLWVYDFRTANRYSLKTRPLARADLDEFVRLYSPGEVQRRGESSNDRWRSFPHSELLADDDCRMDVTWEPPAERNVPTSRGLDRVGAIGLQVADDLNRALAHFANVTDSDPKSPPPRRLG